MGADKRVGGRGRGGIRGGWVRGEEVGGREGLLIDHCGIRRSKWLVVDESDEYLGPGGNSI